MMNIPTTVIDDFFDKPDQIREFGLSLDFEKDPQGQWPGVRTKSLHEIDPVLFNYICKRVISIYYDLNECSNIDWVATCVFQKVNKSYKSGWVHTDQPTIFSNIIYLNKNPNLNSGTSIYKLKKDIIVPSLKTNEDKIKAYQSVISIEEVEEQRKEHNNQYVEVARIHNEYNRLISFDANLPHAAHDFFGEEDEEPRFTMNVFFHELRVTRTPIERVKTSIF